MVNCIFWHKRKFNKRIASTRVLKQILFNQSYFVIIFFLSTDTEVQKFNKEANFIELGCLICVKYKNITVALILQNVRGSFLNQTFNRQSNVFFLTCWDDIKVLILSPCQNMNNIVLLQLHPRAASEKSLLPFFIPRGSLN